MAQSFLWLPGGHTTVALNPGSDYCAELEEKRESGHLGADAVTLCTVLVVARPLYTEYRGLGEPTAELDSLYGRSLRLCAVPIVCLPRLVTSRTPTIATAPLSERRYLRHGRR